MKDGLSALLGALQSGGLDIDAESALDSVWLALRMFEKAQSDDAQGVPAILETTIETGTRALEGTRSGDRTTRETERERRVSGTRQVARNVTSSAPDLIAPGRSLVLSRAAALPESRDLVRALRPLRRRVLSPGQGLLDFETTVRRAAEEDLWIPAFAAARERWLDVLLVADHGLSMIIWKDTIDEFERVLHNSGAFRSVRSWWLESDAAVGVTRRGRGPLPDTPENLTRLARGAERSVVLIISDCVGDRWRDGAIPKLIAHWSRHVPAALIQVTPEWFWARTALGDTVGSRFRSAAPAMANHRFRWDTAALGAGGVSPSEAKTFLRVPAAVLTPDAVARVAGLIAGVSREWAPGVVFDLTWTGDESRPASARSSATDRVARFRSLASRAAQRLAAAFSTSPVSTLGVLRLLRRDLLPDATPFAEAEVLLGGLLHVKREEASWDAGASLQLRFHDGVRSLLQDGAVAGDVLRVLTHAASVAETGVGPTFTSWLNDPSSGTGQLDPDDSAFAAAAAQTLARLGGRYAQIVKAATPAAESETATSVETGAEYSVETRRWESDRAILVVHGAASDPSQRPPVGELLRGILGRPGVANRGLDLESGGVAIYEIQLDHVEDWVVSQARLSPLVAKLIDELTRRIDHTVFGSAAAQTIADLIWPVVLDGPRRPEARYLLLEQLRQIVNDGRAAGVAPHDQKLTIVCHSSGCFHTYEALHHAAITPELGLQPGTHGVRLENVVFVASPVQIIRTMFDSLWRELPSAGAYLRETLYSMRGTSLSIPAQADSPNHVVPSVQRWVSIAGAFDPVGGCFMGTPAPWAYMQVAGQETLLDRQTTLGLDSPSALADCLRNALRPDGPPLMTPDHPHRWENYLDHYESELGTWLRPPLPSPEGQEAEATARPHEAGPHTIPAPTPFVGRHAEVERLAAWIGQPRVARAMALAGPEGIGKSALAHAAIVAWLRRYPEDGPFVWCLQQDPSLHEALRALRDRIVPYGVSRGDNWDESVRRAMSVNHRLLVVFDGVDGLQEAGDVDLVMGAATMVLGNGGHVLFTTREVPERLLPMLLETLDVGPLTPHEMESLASHLISSHKASLAGSNVDESLAGSLSLIRDLAGGNPAVAGYLVESLRSFAPDALRDELARGTGESAVIRVDELPTLGVLLQTAGRVRRATTMALGHVAEGRFEEAAREFDEIVATRSKLPSVRGRAQSLFGRGRVSLQLRRDDRANVDLADAVGIFRRIQAPELPEALEGLADARMRVGRLEDAESHLHEALELNRKNNDLRGTFRALVALAALARQRNDAGAALVLLRESLATAQAAGNPVMMGTAYLSIGRVQQTTGDFARALDSTHAALSQFERADARRELAIALGVVAEVEVSQHNYREARAALERGKVLGTPESEALDAQLRQLDEVERTASAKGGAADVLKGDDRVVSAEFLVSGRVQGVGYRAFVERAANELKLKGTAENMADGSVRVRATGPRSLLKRLEDRLKTGPSGARVDKVQTRLIPSPQSS